MTDVKTPIKELPETFEGKGEVKGDFFQVKRRSATAFMYQRTSPDGTMCYEVFKRKVNTRFNTVTYPSSKAFGLYAWTYRADQFNLALQKFYEL